MSPAKNSVEGQFTSRWWLRHIGNLCLGIAVAGVAVSITDLTGSGIGFTVMFTAFVMFLICYDARQRVQPPELRGAYFT